MTNGKQNEYTTEAYECNQRVFQKCRGYCEI